MESRLKNYLGPTYYRPSVVEMEEIEEDQRPWIYTYSDFMGDEFPINNTMYYHDMTRYIHGTPSLYHRPFLFYPKDRVEAFHVPTLVKSRPIHDRGESILLNLNYKRHFEDVFSVDKLDMPYEEKKDILVWRGATTGYGFGNNIPYRETSRENLVTMYHDSSSPHIDIALSPINNMEKQSYSIYARDTIPMKDMLRYKFVVSIEGNDVATNLKWLLYSNSVPFCLPFTMQSWILEDQLEPWRHYIPLRADLTDVEDKIEWALNHHHKCKEIAKEGRDYMTTFLDIRQERTIVKNILDIYANNVRVISATS
jgi:hypothetical protein